MCVHRERLSSILLVVRHRLTIVVLCILASACSTITMRVSRDELQADLAKRFPKEIDKHLVTIRASDPQIDMPGREGILGVRLRLDAVSASGNSRVGGTARVEGTIQYVEAEHAFYLREPKVTELVLAPAEGDGKLAHAMGHLSGALGNPLVDRAARSAIEELLERHPIYRLDGKRSEKEAKAIRHLRSAHVDGQDLVLEVGL
jgi:hypothetical protein